jgi:hypothetical protein
LAALFFCSQQLTEREREELYESWNTRTDHQVDSEDQEQTSHKLSGHTGCKPSTVQSCQDSILGKTGLEDEYSQTIPQTAPQTAPQTTPKTAPQTVAQTEEPKQLELEERGEIENQESTRQSRKPTSEGL